MRLSFILLKLLLLMIVPLSAQPMCNKQQASAENDELRELIYVRIGKIKTIKDKISQQKYDSIATRYIELQRLFNNLYSKVRDDIAGGLLLKGKGVLCNQYGNEFVKNLKEADKFSGRLNRVIAEAMGYNIPNGISIRDVLPIFVFIRGAAEAGAKDRAERFYSQFAWVNFEDIAPVPVTFK